jgi:uncharacterized SAM-binding protein YcdF (DUF218 family)
MRIMSISPQSRPNARRRWLRYIVVVGVLMVIAAGTVGRPMLLRWIGGQLERQDALATADAIVVLAGGFPNREIETAELFAAGWAPKVFVTDEPEPAGMRLLRERGVAVPTSAQRRADVMVALGVPTQAITVLPPLIQSTAEEAQAVLSVAESHRLTHVIVVTSRWHTARAGLVFRHVLSPTGVRVSMRGASLDPFTPQTWASTRTGLREGLIEWQKLWIYRWQY